MRYTPLLLLLAVSMRAPAQPQPQGGERSRRDPGPPFAQIVEQHFASWDKDSSGELSAQEIDAACVDPGVKGAPAAAVAAMKRIVRSGQYDLPTLTKDYLLTPPPRRGRGERSPDTDRVDSGEVRTSTKRPANFASRYYQSLRRIESTERGLFLDETPDLDRARQGPLGDCFLVAPVGAALMRDPEAIKGMITETEGGYRVLFPSGRAVEFAALTDAELALTSSTGDDGLWLAVLEKALGTLWIELYPDRHTMLSATDAIARGGTTSSIIRLFTGHEVEHMSLRRRGSSRREADRGSGEQTSGEPKTGEQPEEGPDARTIELAERLRSRLGPALEQKRLATATTADDKYPPGISQRHAFAIVKFDAEADTLTLWNPHGYNFRARGEPGLEHGYAQRAGMFTVPVTEFVQVFSGVVIETDRPISSRRRQRSQRRSPGGRGG